MDKIDIKEWLQYHCLAKATYLEDLRAAGYINIKTLKNFPKITEDILDSLNITLAGDRKRFRAIGEQNNLVPDYVPICSFSDSNHVATFMFQLITIFFCQHDDLFTLCKILLCKQPEVSQQFSNVSLKCTPDCR